MVALNIPPDYGYVVLVGSSMFIVNMFVRTHTNINVHIIRMRVFNVLTKIVCQHRCREVQQGLEFQQKRWMHLHLT